jgi:hypothetical protein
MSRFNGAAHNIVPIFYGDYFKAVEAFLSENHFQRLISSVYQHSHTLIIPEKIENISIFLEKHGEYYHPSKIEIITEKKARWEFVLNVAFSKAGLRCSKREFELLRKLRREMPWDFIPMVYEQAEVNLSSGGMKCLMFLGEWFSGFNEFHIHSIDHNGNCLVEVWDQVKGNYFISEKQAYELYRQTALIHTYYHNIETTQQIHPWHHAAGDFVVRISDDILQVKLITIRGYHPIVNNDEKDLRSMLEGLLIFLMDLSLKNRIDRIKGVNDLVWTNDIYVMATIDGFFKGLSKKIQENIISYTFVDYFGKYLTSLNRSMIERYFTDILESWPQQAPELAIIVPKIDSHVFIFESFANIFLSKHFNL